MVVISLEGNVGAGKSTLLNKLKNSNPEYNYIPEPVDTWLGVKDENDDNILKPKMTVIKTIKGVKIFIL